MARDRKGVTAVVMALGATAIIGFTGLAIDVASWEVTLRKMQGAADQAALAALTVANAGGTAGNCPSTACTEAEAIAANYGFVNGQATVKVHQPPSQGNHTSDSSALEVIISQQQSLMFTGLFLSTAPTVEARAVAWSQTGNMCVMALDTSGKQAIGSVDLTGKTAVNMPNCDLYNDSPAAASTELVGSSSLSARNIFLSGGYSETNGTTMTASGSFKNYTTAMPNPYSGLTVPSYPVCTSTEVKNGTIETPSTNLYVYCGGISLNSGATLNLPTPGTYILDQGGLTLNGGATLTGTGVTIILNNCTGSKCGVTINGGATVTLTAPASGATAGIPGVAIWDATTTNQADKFDGGSTENITGAIYAPSQQLTFAGGSSTTTGCTQLIALTVTFDGNANFGNSCTNSGVSEPLLPPTLVE